MRQIKARKIRLIEPARKRMPGATYSDVRWLRARKAHLMEHPLCVYCARHGVVTAADVVDHIVPHRGDSALFWDASNWQSLCKRCHDSVKQKEEKARG